MIYLRSHQFDKSNFDSSVLRHPTNMFYNAMYLEDLTLYRPVRHFVETTVLAVETDIEVTNMGKLHWVFGIQISFNCEAIKVS
jgi:hypothetical protein